MSALNQEVNTNDNEGPDTGSNSMSREHKKRFNQLAFGIGGQSKKSVKSFIMTEEKWKHIVNIISDWNEGDNNQQKEFRRMNPCGYSYVSKFEIRRNQLPNGSEQVRLHRRKNSKMVIHMAEVFDAINDAHQSVGHMKRDPTWVRVKQQYHNISQSLVKEYVQLCPVCNGTNPVVQQPKGAKKPILSHAFRDRFQVDLIDFRQKKKEDIYGNEMRWLMTTKDHSTGLVHLCAIPRKKPQYVAYELEKIFGLIGYPLIFHTDNGNEFTAKEILEFIRELNPDIFTVTGRPRKPSDQGSVENMNKVVKRVISNLEAEERIRGKSPNWTFFLGKAMASINKHVGKGMHAVSSYEATFGMKYDEEIPCSLNDLRSCKTVHERLALTDFTRLHVIAGDHCVLEEPDLSSSSDDESTLNGVRTNLGFDYWEQSDVESDDNNQVDAALAVPSDSKSDNSVELVNTIKVIDTTLAEQSDNVSSTQSKKTKFKLCYSLSKAKKISKTLKPLLRNGHEYRFVYPTLTCSECCFAGQQIITVGDENYLRHIEKSNCWYDSDFIISFAGLTAHASHHESIQLVHIPYVQKPEISECRSLHPSKTQVVSVLHHINHYAVLMADIPAKKITIFDGLLHSLKDWENHCSTILYRCQLITLDTECTFEFTHHTGTILAGEQLWTIHVTNSFISQNDAFNCGPIACLKVMDIFHGTSSTVDDLNKNEYRSTVVNEFRKLLTFHDTDLKVAVPQRSMVSLDNISRAEKDLSASEQVETQITCVACLHLISKDEEIQKMECCNNLLHKLCWGELILHYPFCVFCMKVSNESVLHDRVEVVFSNETPLRQSDILRQKAASSKRKRQFVQAERMKNRRKEYTDSLLLQVGSIVTIRNDFRDIPNPRGTVGIVFNFKESGGINVVTENGVICYGVSLKIYFIPNDRYIINNESTVLTEKLRKIRDQVLHNDFDENNFPKITLQRDHSIMTGETFNGPRRQKCGCKNQCNFRCGCIRNNRACNSSCSCFGNCSNPRNDE